MMKHLFFCLQAFSRRAERRKMKIKIKKRGKQLWGSAGCCGAQSSSQRCKSLQWCSPGLQPGVGEGVCAWALKSQKAAFWGQTLHGQHLKTRGGSAGWGNFPSHACPARGNGRADHSCFPRPRRGDGAGSGPLPSRGSRGRRDPAAATCCAGPLSQVPPRHGQSRPRRAGIGPFRRQVDGPGASE